VVAVASRVGKAKKVGLGGGRVGVSVGGRVAVAVGMAAWVCAAISFAISMAVAITCAESNVGVALGPHADSKTVSPRIRGKTFFMWCSLYFLLMVE
jgi:hypothetical protein